MKSVLKVSLAALTLAFAVSSHAADKKLVGDGYRLRSV